MTNFQKTVKYIAMAFAIFLTVSIIGGILSMLVCSVDFSAAML